MRTYGMMPLAFLALLVFVSACSPSPETRAFIDALPQLNENIGTDLRDIDAHFENYDLKFRATTIVNLDVIPNSSIIGMERIEEDITRDVATAWQSVVSYNQLKSAADVGSLPPETAVLVPGLDSKVSAFNADRETIISCLDRMREYRGFAGLLSANAALFETLELQTSELQKHVSADRTQDALNQIDEIQKTIEYIQKNAESRTATGIQIFSQETLGYYAELMDSYDVYGQYVLEEDEDRAESLYRQYSEIRSDAVAMITDDDAGVTNKVNEIDAWYQSNIGVCINLFHDV